MTNDAWRILRAPFPTDAVHWHVVAVRDEGRRMQLAPHLAIPAIRRRLDDAFGSDGWSLTLAPWREAMLIATIDVGDVQRSAIATVLGAPGLDASGASSELTVQETVTGAGWTAALETLGVTLPVQVDGDGVVDADPERGEPLHPPEVILVDVTDAQTVPQDADGRGEASTSPAVVAGAAPLSETADPEAHKPEGHKMIDRIVERLRGEGLGADVARLVTRYGGYGQDADASRALYAELRALLRERTTGG